MSVVATDGKVMAADRLAIDANGVVVAHRDKIRRVGDMLVGASGDAFDIEPFCAWLADPESERPTLSDETNMLVLMPNGTVRAYDSKCRFLDEEMLPAAIGCGAEIAIGAMEAGASPKQAVAIAVKRHTGCSGGVTVLKLKER